MKEVIMGQEKINKFTKMLLDVMFFFGVLICGTLPFTLRLAGRIYSREFVKHYVSMLLIFALAGICGVLIVWELRKMMATVVLGDCFVWENVKSLKRMATYSMIIAFVFIVKMFITPTPATAVIVLTFFIAALFSLVLSSVFAKAIRFKEENDLTI